MPPYTLGVDSDIGQPQETKEDLLREINDYYATAKPETPASPAHSVNDYYEAPFNFWKASEPSPLLDERYTIDPAKFFRYEFKPLRVMLPFGTLGVLLMAGQFLVPYKLVMVSGEDWTGLLRLGMILAGSVCIFLAWPRYRDLRISEEEEAETEALREHFAHIRFPKKQ